jgi:hypothetical protein
MLATGFNNRDKSGLLVESPDPSMALENATALYDSDIRYLQAIRKSLAKRR